MKNFIIFLTLSLLTFYRCQFENSNSANELIPISSFPGNGNGTFVKPDRHWSPCHRNKCKFPAHDCFPDIIVTPQNIYYIAELDNHILNNTVSTFFQVGGNYEEIYPGLFGKALTDLRNGITTLRKVLVSDSIIAYRIVMFNDTSIQADYYFDYEWEIDSMECNCFYNCQR